MSKAKFIIEPTQPVILFTEQAFYKMFAAAHSKSAGGKEIMWLGVVNNDEPNLYVVEDIVFPPQAKNSATYVETDDDRFPEWVGQFDIKQRKALRLHGHLHPNFSTTPSGTDESLFKQLLSNISDYYLRIIVNKSYEYTLDLFDKKNNLIFNECSFHIEIVPGMLYTKSTPKGTYELAFINGAKIEDVPYTIKDNNLVFNIAENVTFEKEIFTNKSELNTNLLKFKDNKLYIQETNEEIDNTLNDMIKKFSYTPTTDKWDDKWDDYYYNQYGYSYNDLKDKALPTPKTKTKTKTTKTSPKKIGFVEKDTFEDDLDKLFTTPVHEISEADKAMLIASGMVIALDFEACMYYELTLDELHWNDTTKYAKLKREGKL